jgi:hypothetical protein
MPRSSPFNRRRAVEALRSGCRPPPQQQHMASRGLHSPSGMAARKMARASANMCLHSGSAPAGWSTRLHQAGKDCRCGVLAQMNGGDPSLGQVRPGKPTSTSPCSFRAAPQSSRVIAHRTAHGLCPSTDVVSLALRATNQSKTRLRVGSPAIRIVVPESGEIVRTKNHETASASAPRGGGPARVACHLQFCSPVDQLWLPALTPGLSPEGLPDAQRTEPSKRTRTRFNGHHRGDFGDEDAGHGWQAPPVEAASGLAALSGWRSVQSGPTPYDISRHAEMVRHRSRRSSVCDGSDAERRRRLLRPSGPGRVKYTE